MVTRTALPDEAADMTTSELHEYVLHGLVDVLRYLFGDSALVLADIFVRVDDADQVAPDLMVVPSAQRGARTVYRIPGEAVPAVTVEVLSPVNYQPDGRRQLEHKRSILGRIGVPVHIEVDPDRGYVTVWGNTGSELVLRSVTDGYGGVALGGLRIELPAPGEVRLFLPDGREFVDAPAEMARADAEAARADAEAERACRLAAALRSAGIDPGSV